MPKSNPAIASAIGGSEISRLRQQIENLQNQLEQQGGESGGIQAYPLEKFTPLRLGNGLAQPRKYFDPAGIDKLKASIAKVGVREPLLVRPSQGGKLEIISGERRWRCALALELESLPAICREHSDEEALEIALVANLMRENLNIIEETDSIIALMGLRLGIDRDDLPPLLTKILNLRNRRSLSNEDIAQEIQTGDGDFSGKITPSHIDTVDEILDEFKIGLTGFVTNRLNAIAKMPPDLLEKVREGCVDFSKADLIRKAPQAEQAGLLRDAIEQGWTKAELAQEVKLLKDADKGEQRNDSVRDRIHDLYIGIRRKKTWEKIEANPKLIKQVQKIEELLNRLAQAAEE